MIRYIIFFVALIISFVALCSGICSIINKDKIKSKIETEIMRFKIDNLKKVNTIEFQKKDSVIKFNTGLIEFLKKQNGITEKKIKNEIKKLREKKDYVRSSNDSIFSYINDSILSANGLN